MAEEQQSVSVSGWGKKFGITGPNAFPWLVILLLLAGIGYQSVLVPNDLNVKLSMHIMTMQAQHQTITEAMDRFTYVQWLCSPLNTNEDARRRCSMLNLMEPPSIGLMQRR